MVPAAFEHTNILNSPKRAYGVELGPEPVMGTHSFIRYIITVTSLVTTVTNKHLQ
jgi:hypothetical protein